MTFRRVGTVGLIVVGILWFARSSSIDAGPQPRATPPPGCNRWEGPRNTITLFDHDGFRGERYHIRGVTDRAAPGQFVSIPPHLRDRTTSLQWNLPPGVTVLLSNHTDGTGNLFPIWGSYRSASIKRWDVSDKFSAWAWYRTF